MGTRGLLGVHTKGQPNGAYNHWDSYDLSFDVAKFLAQISKAELRLMSKMVNELEWVGEEEPVKPAELAEQYAAYGYSYDKYDLDQTFHRKDTLWGNEWIELWESGREVGAVVFGDLAAALDLYLGWGQRSEAERVNFNDILSEFAVDSNTLARGVGEDEDEAVEVGAPLGRPDRAGPVATLEERLQHLSMGVADEAIVSEKDSTQDLQDTKTSSATASGVDTITKLPTELHLHIIRYLQPEPAKTFCGLYEDSKVLLCAQWALKRSCTMFWHLDDLITPSTFFSRPTPQNAISTRHTQRLIAAAFAPSNFPSARFPCFACITFFTKENAYAGWGGAFYAWPNQHPSCCKPCLTKMAQDLDALQRFLEPNATELDDKYFHNYRTDLAQDALKRLKKLMDPEFRETILALTFPFGG